MISPKDILTIDATVIAGFLILIGVIASSESLMENTSGNATENTNELLDPYNPKDWAYYGGVGFGVSAFFAVIISVYDENTNFRLVRVLQYISIGSMGAGFAYLTYGFYLLGF